MADAPEDSRRFSDEEVALIIKRAAELQHTEQHVEQEKSPSMSLMEIEQVAREAGIDPQLVRRAAQGLDRPATTSRPSVLTGAPTRLAYERVVEGEISVDDFEGFVNEMRRTFGENGVPSVLGRTLAWSSITSVGPRGQGRGRNIDISVTVRGGLTTIRAEEELRNLAVGVFAPTMAGVGSATFGLVFPLVMAASQSAPLAGAAMVASLGGLYAFARGLFGRISRKRDHQLRELVERLERMACDAVEKRQAQISAGAPRSLPASEGSDAGG
jgi:hypothetical protein